MRITGGAYRGRLLASPKDKTIRPTSDKVRAAIFNILAARGLIDSARVLDAFCGTGALGLEALSRNAFCCTFMDKNRDSLGLAKANFAALKIDAQHYFTLADATRPGARPDAVPAASLIFLDPPYDRNLIPQALPALAAGGWMEDGAHIIVESEKAFAAAALPPGYDVLMERAYGDTKIMLLQKGGAS